MMPLLAGIVFSCVREPEAPLSDGQIPQETYAPDDEGVLKGWVRIKLRDDAQALRVGTFTRGAMESGDPELDRIAASLGATEVRRVFHEGGRFAERRRKFGLHLWYDVKFDDTLPVTRAQAAGIRCPKRPCMSRHSGERSVRGQGLSTTRDFRSSGTITTTEAAPSGSRVRISTSSKHGKSLPATRR